MRPRASHLNPTGTRKIFNTFYTCAGDRACGAVLWSAAGDILVLRRMAGIPRIRRCRSPKAAFHPAHCANANAPYKTRGKEQTMNDVDREIFRNYSRHYQAGEVRERLPDDLERLKRDRLPRWLNEVPTSARILDVGCAQGHWLEALRRVGYTHLAGIELSAELLATARARLPEWVQLEQADLREWLRRAPPESFDVVFFHDVLEHLPREDTIEVLRGFHRLLAPGGKLSVRVPNMACLISGFCMAIDFTHQTHFTEYSLLQVLEAAGFDTGKIRFEQQAPRLFWSWRQPRRAVFRLLNRLRWQINNAVHRGFYVLADFICPKVFDPILVVVAQK